MMWGMWLAGFETTAAGISGGVYSTLCHRGSAEWLDRDQDSANAFVEEVLRYESPLCVTGLPRNANADIQFGAGIIPQGDGVVALLAAANHDPAVFERPDIFDPARASNKRLISFGRGLHGCIGTLLARMEMRTVLPIIHRRLPHLELAAPATRRVNSPLRTFDSLPVALVRS